MLKFGLLQREQFLTQDHRNGVERLLSVFSKGRVSYRLLHRPPQPSSGDSELFERLMPYIRLSSGTYRTTYPGRFRNLDPEVNQLLASTFDAQRPLEVQDWAASACLTSSEWAQSLFPVFARMNLVASDILLFLVELQDDNGGVFIFEPGGAPLQFVKSPFVIRMTPAESWKLPVNYWLCRKASQRWQALNPLPDCVQDWIASPTEDVLETNGLRFAKLSLIHPEAAQLAQTDHRFRTHCQSVFEPLASPVQVIRTMNIFNRAYFSEDQLARGAAAVIDSLSPGGIWILGRTVQEEPPVHEVTILRKSGSSKIEMPKEDRTGLRNRVHRTLKRFELESSRYKSNHWSRTGAQ